MFDKFNQTNKNDDCQVYSEIMLFDVNNLGYAGQFMYCAWTVGRRKRKWFTWHAFLIGGSEVRVSLGTCLV